MGFWKHPVHGHHHQAFLENQAFYLDLQRYTRYRYLYCNTVRPATKYGMLPPYHGTSEVLGETLDAGPRVFFRHRDFQR